MEADNWSWKEYHHGIYLIYHGLIALTLVPFAFLLLEWDTATDKASFSYVSMSALLISQLFWVIAYISWYVWRGKKMKLEVHPQMSLEERLGEFKLKAKRKYIALSVAGILAALAMWLLPSFIFVVAYFGVLVQYSFLRPSEDRIVRDMEITKEQRRAMHRS